MKRQTQVQRIYKALKAGRVLTMLDIYKLCGSMNGHKRINECNKNIIWHTKDEYVVCGWRTVNGRRIRTWRLAK